MLENIAVNSLEPEVCPQSPPEEGMTVAQLQNALRRASGKNVLLMLTDNCRTMLSRKEEAPGVVILRAHKMFLHAPQDVISELGHWVAGKRSGSGNHVQHFIDNNTEMISRRQSPLRQNNIVTQGKYHDLAHMAMMLNETYLQGRSKAPVTWGRKITKRNVRQIRLGWYDPVRNLITISQRLDRRDIPAYMVEYVLFHEMLHEVLGIGVRADGKRDIHGKMFKMLEQTYPHYDRALEFERKKWGNG